MLLQCIDQLEGDYCVMLMTRSVFCSAVQCNVVQCSAEQCSAVQCSIVQCLVKSSALHFGEGSHTPFGSAV